MFAKFLPDRIKSNLTVGPLISPKRNHIFAQTSQNVVVGTGQV